MTTPTIAEVFRDWVSFGIPASGDHDPRKADIRAWGTWVEQFLAALAADAGGVTELPELIYYFTVTGGTGNAIIATPNATPPTAPGAALLTMQVIAVNTGAVTLNGKSLRANGGEELQAGEVQAGDLLAFLDLGSQYRLITDPGSLRNKLAAMEWANKAEDSPVSLAAGGDGSTTFSAKHWAAKSAADAQSAGEASDISVASAALAQEAAQDATETVTGLVFADVPEIRAGTSTSKITSPYIVTEAFKYRGIITPMDFGVPAVGGDITDLMLDVADADDVLSITLPPGVWNIEDEAIFNNRPFSLAGFGQEISQIVQQTVGKSCIRFISTQEFSRYGGVEARTIGLTVRDVAFVSACENSAAAIYAEWVDRVDETCFFEASNVKIISDGFENHFDTAIHLKNPNGTRIKNLQMVGDSASRDSASATPYGADVGIFLECQNGYPKVSHDWSGIRTRDINTLVKLRGWIEGLTIEKSDLVLCGRCIDYDGFSAGEGGAQNPNLSVTDCHLNFRESGLYGRDFYNLFFDNNDLLKDGEPTASVDGNCIHLVNSPVASITNNRFAAAGVHAGVIRGVYAYDNVVDYRITGNSMDRMLTENVLLAGTGIGNIVAGNVFVGSGSPQIGVRFGEDIIESIIDGNKFRGTWALRVDDIGKQNDVRSNSPEDGLVQLPPNAVPDALASPSVAGYNSKSFLLNNSAMTFIIQFVNPTVGDEVFLVANNGNSTIVHSADIILEGGVNWNMPAGATLSLKWDGASWREKGRVIV